MAEDNEYKIKIVTDADTSGAEKAEEAVKDVKEAADDLSDLSKASPSAASDSGMPGLPAFDAEEAEEAAEAIKDVVSAVKAVAAAKQEAAKAPDIDFTGYSVAELEGWMKTAEQATASGLGYQSMQDEMLQVQAELERRYKATAEALAATRTETDALTESVKEGAAAHQDAAAAAEAAAEAEHLAALKAQRDADVVEAQKRKAEREEKEAAEKNSLKGRAKELFSSEQFSTAINGAASAVSWTSVISLAKEAGAQIREVGNEAERLGVKLPESARVTVATLNTINGLFENYITFFENPAGWTMDWITETAREALKGLEESTQELERQKQLYEDLKKATRERIAEENSAAFDEVMRRRQRALEETTNELNRQLQIQRALKELTEVKADAQDARALAAGVAPELVAAQRIAREAQARFDSIQEEVAQAQQAMRVADEKAVQALDELTFLKAEGAAKGAINSARQRLEDAESNLDTITKDFEAKQQEASIRMESAAVTARANLDGELQKVDGKIREVGDEAAAGVASKAMDLVQIAEKVNAATDKGGARLKQLIDEQAGKVVDLIKDAEPDSGQQQQIRAAMDSLKTAILLKDKTQVELITDIIAAVKESDRKYGKIQDDLSNLKALILGK